MSTQSPQNNDNTPLYTTFAELYQHGFKLNPVIAGFIITTHILGFTLIPLIWYLAPSAMIMPMLVWVAAHYVISGLAITCYNHRLISHNAVKKVSWPVHAFFCFFAQPLAVEGSVRQWASNHIIHHGVDRNGKHHLDPYSATWFDSSWRNFLWSHIFAHMFKHPESEEAEIAFRNMGNKSAVINFQHRFYLPIMIFWIFLVPMGLGFVLGSWAGMAAMLAASLSGMLVAQHNTWTVNSVTHMWGFKNGLISSAKNNYLWLGPLGEGNHHADHHDCPTDYRNGFGKLAWLLDPTRYVILFLSGLGLVKGLKRVSKFQEARTIAKRQLRDAKLSAEKRAKRNAEPFCARFAELEEKIVAKKNEWLDAVAHFEALKKERQALKRQLLELEKRVEESMAGKMDKMLDKKHELEAKLNHLKHEVLIAKQVMMQKKDAFFLSFAPLRQA